MDRATVYAGQIPREVDILNAGKYGVIGVGMLAQAALGTDLVVDGFSLTPTAPASLIATLSPGQVYQVENIDATAWSSLAADSRSIVKQGVLLDATALTFAPPTTAGYAQSFLVEVQHQDVDTDAKVLPYYNAAAPSQGFAGPGGSGAAQNTNRRSLAVVQVKAGTAATAGTQQPPTPDAGWAPLFIVTLNAGQTTVTAGNISVHPNAPFIPVKLPGIPVAVQAGKWTYAVASGANTLSASLSPAPPALVDGLTFGIKCPSANTGAVTLALNSFGALPVVRKDGAPLQAGDIATNDVVRLTYSGGVFGFVGFARSEIAAVAPPASIVHFGTATATSTNAYAIAALAPEISALATGMIIEVDFPSANTGAVTLALNDLTPAVTRAVVRTDGSPLKQNDIVGGPTALAVRADGRLSILNYNPVNAPARNNITFRASGTFTVPPGCFFIYAQVWGAGGGGGGGAWSGTNTVGGAGAGGGGGGYDDGFYYVTPGQVIPITVGTGGAGGTGSNSGGPGGTTSVGSLISATGGGGGAGAQDGLQGNGNGQGGQGYGGNVNATGAAGGTAYTVTPGNSAGASGGIGGACPFGGASPSLNVGGAGSSGNFPGSGGNASANNTQAGAGAPGLVRISY